MNRWILLFAMVLVVSLVAIGCSGGGQDPVAPTTDLGVSGAQTISEQPQTHLWGYYDCHIDLETMTVEAVENRSTAFAANVTQFVNGNPANLSFNIKGTPVGTDYIDVDIEVGITHPFPGMAMYDGYDVRGIFIGDGSGSLAYSSDLDYPELGTDQCMLMGDTGAPDGYTRWYNRKEFGTPGLFGYTPGLFASKAFLGNATLCPYKYFADGLSAGEDLWEFLTTSDDEGVFGAGKTNKRDYYLRFPNSKGVVYGYAIVANWIDETTHPANAPEAVGCDVLVTDNIYYVDDTSNGGDLILDLSLFSWIQQPEAIYIESNMLNDVYMLDAADMVPVGGADNYATYHVEIPTDLVESTEGNTFWVIAELADFDYKNDLGVTNSAGSDPLAAFFQFDVVVADEPFNFDPVCDMEVVTPMPHVGNGHIEFDASGSYDPDPGDVITFSWDFDDDGVFGDEYDEGTDDNPIKYYSEDYVGEVCLLLEDGIGGSTTCCVEVDITYQFLPNSYPCAGVTPVTYDSTYECTSGATVLPSADDGYVQVPIGFTFSYGTSNYTLVYVNRNGTISFGAGFYCCTPYCTTTNPPNHISGIADDLNSTQGGQIKYETRMIGGVNAFIAEWDGVPSYYNSGSNTGQVILWDTPQTQYDDFYIQVLLHYDTYNDLFYRKSGTVCCLYTSGVPNNSRWEFPGQEN